MDAYIASGLYQDNGTARGIVGVMRVDEQSGRFSIGRSSSISGLVMLESERTGLVFLTSDRRFEVRKPSSDPEDLSGRYEGRSVALSRVGIDEGERAVLELF